MGCRVRSAREGTERSGGTGKGIRGENGEGNGFGGEGRREGNEVTGREGKGRKNKTCDKDKNDEKGK